MFEMTILRYIILFNIINFPIRNGDRIFLQKKAALKNAAFYEITHKMKMAYFFWNSNFPAPGYTTATVSPISYLFINNSAERGLITNLCMVRFSGLAP